MEGKEEVGGVQGSPSRSQGEPPRSFKTRCLLREDGGEAVVAQGGAESQLRRLAVCMHLNAAVEKLEKSGVCKGVQDEEIDRQGDLNK